MDYLPLFIKSDGQRALVVGDTAQAHRKVELLIRAGLSLLLPDTYRNLAMIKAIQNEELTFSIQFYQEFEDSLMEHVDFVVIATNEVQQDEKMASLAKARHLPVNVVNQPKLSTFIFPSIIDRSPMIVAISSSSELPVLTRLIRNKLESILPHGLGRLATIAGEFRKQVSAKYSAINQRRRFWEKNLEGKFAELIYAGNESSAKQFLSDALNDQYDDIGEVYLVGAGPGDPDLLTFKALRLIRQADIVLYDRLVSKPILNLVRSDAEKVDVGKERANHTLPQQQINELLVTLAKQGKRVLRLKGGDPFIFGRGGEEIDRLAQAGVPFQVVPGITAASGCSSYAGIPLTHRDYSQSVRFITGHLKNNTCDLPWNEFVHPNQTLVFYMGLTGLASISQQLIKHGMSADMPVALISKGTTPDQKVITGRLVDIAEKVHDAGISAPTLIIIGEVVALRDKLNWLSS